MNKSFWMASALFVGGAFLGVWATFYSWGGMFYFFPDDNRTPAAIPRVFDFSNLEGTALKAASQENLLANAKALHNDKAVGIELGQFVTRSKAGRSEYACRIYNKVELQFHANDSAVSGEPVVMTVQSPCEFSDDVNHIAAIWIPMAKIMNEDPGDVDLKFPEDQPSTYRFSNMSDEWPQKWVLVGVRLYSDTDSRELVINRDDISRILKKPLQVTWDK